MQSIAGTSLAASRTANRASCIKLEVQWDGTNWTDESARIISASGMMQVVKRAEGIAGVGAGIASDAILTLDNHDRRYSVWNSGGALYAYIGSNQWKGIPTRLWGGYKDAGGTPEYVSLHRGVIENLAPSWASDGQRATMKLSDKTSYASHRGKSQLYRNVRTDQMAQYVVNLIPEAIRPTLTADVGLFSLPWAWVDDEDLWSELGLLAEAEGGRVYYSNAADNTLIFENATHMLTAASSIASQATFAINTYSSAQVPTDYLGYWNHVVVEYMPYKLHPRQVVWQASGQPLRVKPGATETIEAIFDHPVYELDTPVEDEDYIAVTAGGTRASSDVSLSVTSYAQQASIAVTNSGDMTVFLLRNRLMGRPVIAGDVEKCEATATGTLADRGKVTKYIPGNRYIQTREHAQALADFLLERGQEPRTAAPVRNIDWMPWLQVGDRVTLTEQGGASVGAFFVHQIPWTWIAGQGGHIDPVCLPAGLFAYDDYFVLGTNTLGDESATPGRAFY